MRTNTIFTNIYNGTSMVYKYRSKQKPVQINMRVKFLIIAILKDSEKFLMQVYELFYNSFT